MVIRIFESGKFLYHRVGVSLHLLYQLRRDLARISGDFLPIRSGGESWEGGRCGMEIAAREAVGQAGGDFVLRRLQERGDLLDAELLRALPPDADHLLARLHIGNVGDIHDRLIHTDAAQDRGALPPYQHPAPPGEAARIAVAISDQHRGDAAVPCEVVGCAITDGVAGGQTAYRGYARFEGEGGLYRRQGRVAGQRRQDAVYQFAGTHQGGGVDGNAQDGGAVVGVEDVEPRSGLLQGGAHRLEGLPLLGCEGLFRSIRVGEVRAEAGDAQPGGRGAPPEGYRLFG